MRPNMGDDFEENAYQVPGMWRSVLHNGKKCRLRQAETERERHAFYWFFKHS